MTDRVREANKKAIEGVLCKRILIIDEESQTYTGYPSQLINEIADALPNQIELLAGAFKKIFPPEILELIIAYAAMQLPNVDWNDVR